MIKKVEVAGINVNIGGHRTTITREEAEELCRELSKILYGKESGLRLPELPRVPKLPELPNFPVIEWYC